MLNFKKLFNLKIVSVLAAGLILLNSAVYGKDLSEKACLRIPVLNSSSEGTQRAGEALTALARQINHNKVVLIALRSEEHERLQVPLAVGILKKDLEKDGREALAIDMQEVSSSVRHPNQTKARHNTAVINEVMRRIKEANPAMITVSAFIKTINLSNDPIKQLEGDRLLDALQQEGLMNRVAIGGPMTTFRYSDILKKYDVVLAIGEGEGTVRHLMEYMNDARDLSEIEGVAYRESKIGGAPANVIKQQRTTIFGLEGLGIPDRDTFMWILDKKGTVWAQASRGCYDHCTFCSVNSTKIMCSKWRGRLADDVVRGMEQMARWYVEWADARGITSEDRELIVCYADDDFMGNGNAVETVDKRGELIEPHLKRAEEISRGFRAIQERIGIRVKWNMSTKADTLYRCSAEEYNKAIGMPPDAAIPAYVRLDTAGAQQERERIWSVLKENGLERVFIGIDSGSATQLKRYGKLSGLVNNEKAIDVCRKLGIQLMAGFITFDQLMSLQELTDNISFMKKEHVYELITNPLSTLRIADGTAYKRLAHRAGVLGELQDNILFFDAKYLHPLVGMINEITQVWVGKQYRLIYAIKGQADQDSRDSDKAAWWRYLEGFKRLDFELLDTLTKKAKELSAKFMVSDEEWQRFGEIKLGIDSHGPIRLSQERIDELSRISEEIKIELQIVRQEIEAKRMLHVKELTSNVIEGKVEDIDGIITRKAGEFFDDGVRNISQAVPVERGYVGINSSL